MAIRPRDLRLRKDADIRELFRSGRRLHEPPFKVYFRPTDLGHPRCGVQVSRRTAKRAVTRNRIRRRTREALRGLLIERELGVDIMVLAGAEAATLAWDDLVARCRRVVERIGQQLGEQITHHAEHSHPHRA